MTDPQNQHENTDDTRDTPLDEFVEETPDEPAAASYRTPGGDEPPTLPGGGFGSILDSTFSTYGAHLLPFILIALIPQIPRFLGDIVAVAEIGPVYSFEIFTAPGQESLEPTSINLVSLPAILLSIALSILATGALIQSVGRHFLGRPVLVQRSYKYAWERFPKLLGAIALVVLILIVPAALSVFLIGIPLLIFAILAVFFVNHAVIVEQYGPVDAIKRSWNVIQGNWWRTLGFLVALTLPSIGAVLIIFVPAGIFLPPLLIFLLSTVFSTIVTPLFAIAITVLYLNIRVRKEEYTHNDLARELGELEPVEPQYEPGG